MFLNKFVKSGYILWDSVLGQCTLFLNERATSLANLPASLLKCCDPLKSCPEDWTHSGQKCSVKMAGLNDTAPLVPSCLIVSYDLFFRERCILF